MGRKGGGLLTSVLLRRLESFKTKHRTVDEAVEYLRSNYPDYSRLKLQVFTRIVQTTLDQQQKSKGKNVQSSPSQTLTPFNFDEDDDNEDIQTSARKKIKKTDASEERLLRIENKHRLRKFSGIEPSSASSSEEDGEEDEEDGAVSTSEDAIYGEKLDNKFDLFQSMLRENYGRNTSTNVEEELEDVEKSNKMIETNKIQRGGRRRRGGGGERVEEKEKVKGSGSSFETKGRKDGPKFADLGGMDTVLEELKMEVIVPLFHPQLPLWLGVRPMAGILLHGPPGCGKTKLAHAIANETGVPFYKISAPEVVSGVSGASEENIRELFTKAYRTAPSIVFIDEIDAIASKRESLQKEMERRIVTQLMTCMDDSHKLVSLADVDSKSESSDRRPGYVLVIGATNRPDAVDPALRRPGRFDREIVLGVPDENARVKILSVLTQNLRLEGSFDLAKIAQSTPGFVGADLSALANKAGNLAMKRIIDGRKSELYREPVHEEITDEEWWRHPWLPEEMENLSITMADFEEAAKIVQPSLRREGFSTIPNVKWEDVGGLEYLREEFHRYIVRHIKHPKVYEEFGLDLEPGFLLYGPPGCGKTLIAKAVANEAGANFIHIKGPELLNKYVGESELAVRTIFSRARTCAPCILFFDEVDALTPKRGREGDSVVDRVLTQLLMELSGADQRRGVFVIGATNRPEVMDPAVLRPGRFGKLLYVPLPSPDERGQILKALARKKPIDGDVDLIAIGRKEACENLSGADLSSLVNEAAMVALDDKLTSTQSGSVATSWTIKAAHFELALGKVSPSVSDKQKQYYENLAARFRAA